MKKFLSLTAIIFAAQLSFASGKPADAASVNLSFSKDFYGATMVQWQHGEGYEKASFLLDNRLMNAYYTADGELLAVTRNIISEQLPLKLLMELKKHYSGLWISELFEVVSESDDAYYITLENGDEKLILKAKANKTWKLYKKIAKF